MRACVQAVETILALAERSKLENRCAVSGIEEAAPEPEPEPVGRSRVARSRCPGAGGHHPATTLPPPCHQPATTLLRPPPAPPNGFSRVVEEAKDMLEEKLCGARRVRFRPPIPSAQDCQQDIRQRAVGILERYFGESEIEAMTDSDDGLSTTDDSDED